MSGRVLGAVILPHGDLAWDPSMNDFANGSLELFVTSREVRSGTRLIWIFEVFHGIFLTQNFT